LTATTVIEERGLIVVSNKIPLNKKTFLLIAYVAILGSIGLAIFLLSNKNFTDPKARQGLIDSLGNQEIQKHMSQGEKILVTADNNPDKLAATKAFAEGDYNKTIELLNNSLQIKRNDPEAWIYLNNATAALRGDTVVIAAAVPIGRNLNVAKEILRGVAQAQHEINQKGGVDGKLVQVILANDDNDPELAKRIASEFVKNKSILAVIGHNASDTSIAAASIYQEGGLVAITPTSGAREISGIGSYIFRTTPAFRVTAEVLADYAVKSARKTKIAICADSSDRGSTSFQEEFTWTTLKSGGEISATKCDFSQADFNATEIPSKVISDGADALLLVPSVNKINQALEIIKANKNRLVMFGNQSMYTFETLKEGQSDINGMTFSVIWHPSVNSNKNFMANAENLWGGAGSWRTATSYDATQAALIGLKSGLKRETLQKALSNSGFSFLGATGEIRFLASGDRKGSAILVKVQPGKKSGTGFDFVPIDRKTLENSQP
jgi:branched-chain amino acid transport system substrate-binding protein